MLDNENVENGVQQKKKQKEKLNMVYIIQGIF